MPNFQNTTGIVENGVLAVAPEASDIAPGASADLWLVRSAR